jgi:hypothetical protein
MKKNDLEYVAVELQRPRPSDNFHGRIAEGQFVAEDGYVLIYDMQGQRLAREPIPPNWTARQTAARALKSRESLRSSDFSRKIVYERNNYH